MVSAPRELGQCVCGGPSPVHLLIKGLRFRFNGEGVLALCGKPPRANGRICPKENREDFAAGPDYRINLGRPRREYCSFSRRVRYRPQKFASTAYAQSPDKIPENYDYAAQELLEAPEAYRLAMLENIAKALTRRLLKDEPGIGGRDGAHGESPRALDVMVFASSAPGVTANALLPSADKLGITRMTAKGQHRTWTCCRI